MSQVPRNDVTLARCTSVFELVPAGWFSWSLCMFEWSARPIVVVELAELDGARRVVDRREEVAQLEVAERELVLSEGGAHPDVHE